MPYRDVWEFIDVYIKSIRLSLNGQRGMELTTTLSKLFETRNALLLIPLITLFCLFLVGFLAFASILLIFVVIPFSIVFGAPFRVFFFIFRQIRALFAVPTDYFSPVYTPKELQASKTPSAPSALTPSPLSRFRELEPTDSPSFNSQVFLGSNGYTNGTSEAIISKASESDTFKNVGSLNITTDVPNVLGVSLFMDSPMEYHRLTPKDHRPRGLQALPFAIVEQILEYLPPRSISNLALASNSFGRQIRFYRVYTGNEYVSLQTLSHLVHQPDLGEYVRQLVIDHAFYRPSIKSQWLLEGSKKAVAQAHWHNVEHRKTKLLADALKSCGKISSLSWSEGHLPLPPGILKKVKALLCSTIRRLDIHADSHQLLMHLPEVISHQAGTLRLEHITVRGGFSSKSLVDISTLLLLTKRFLRSLRFVKTQFTNTQRQCLSETLHELTVLERLEFLDSIDMDGKQVPLSYLGQQGGSGFDLVIANPMPSSGSLRIMFNVSPLYPLSNLNSIILTVSTHEMIGKSLGPSLTAARSALHEVVAAATNLRVFSCNSPIEDWSSRRLYDPEMDGELPPLVPYDLAEALCRKQKLSSLSITTWRLSSKQLTLLCENLSQLRHLAVYMQGEVKEISKYSPNFFKLPELLVLDLAISPFDTDCPCGHEADPRIPHLQEGTSMGRITHRLNAKKSKEQNSMKLRLVRVSQKGWFPEPVHFNTHWNYELHWVESAVEARRDLEYICGPCHDTDEVVRKIFNPSSWI